MLLLLLLYYSRVPPYTAGPVTAVAVDKIQYRQIKPQHGVKVGYSSKLSRGKVLLLVGSITHVVDVVVVLLWRVVALWGHYTRAHVSAISPRRKHSSSKSTATAA